MDDNHGEWVECWQCSGNGNIAGCFEDTCSCMGDPSNPDGRIRLRSIGARTGGQVA